MELALWVYFIETVLTVELGVHLGVLFGGYCAGLLVVGVIGVWGEEIDGVPFKDTWTILAKPTYKPAAWIIGTVFVLNLIGQFIPSKETAYTMAAAYGIGEVYKVASESEDVQRLASKSLLVLEQSLDKYLSEEPVEETSDQATED